MLFFLGYSVECFIADITFFLLEQQTDQANKSPMSGDADCDGGIYKFSIHRIEVISDYFQPKVFNY